MKQQYILIEKKVFKIMFGNMIENQNFDYFCYPFLKKRDEFSLKR